MVQFPAPPPAIGRPRSARTTPGKRLESARFAPPYSVTGDFRSLRLVASEYPTPVYPIPAGGLLAVIELWILARLAARSRHYVHLNNFPTLLLRRQ